MQTAVIFTLFAKNTTTKREAGFSRPAIRALYSFPKGGTPMDKNTYLEINASQNTYWNRIKR